MVEMRPMLPRGAWLVLTALSAVVVGGFVASVWGHSEINLLGVIIAAVGLFFVARMWFLLWKYYRRSGGSMASSDERTEPLPHGHDTGSPSWTLVRVVTVLGLLIVGITALIGRVAPVVYTAAFLLGILGLRVLAGWVKQRRGD